MCFPCEENILDILREVRSAENNNHEESTDQETEDTDVLPTVQEATKGPLFQFKSFNQPVAVVWDEGDIKRWYIGFYLDDNEDGTFRVDHLICAGTEDEIWHRPPGSDDIQDTIEQQIVPVTVSGTWDFSKRKPSFLIYNANEIRDTPSKIM